MPMSPRLLRPIASRSLVDADAAAYLTAVETADTQALEPAVRNAITAFVIGCKADGIWDAIKASCILMGARTLSGALTPLKGGAPTNVNNNFVSGDYNRETGLKGNGTNKFLNSNRNNNADLQDNQHLGIYVSTANTQDSNRGYIGCGLTDNGSSHIFSTTTLLGVRSQSNSGPTVGSASAANTGFIGKSRNNGSSVDFRSAATNFSVSAVSQVPLSQNIVVFGRNLAAQADAAIAFYSIGSALDLALLDTRVTALYNAIGSAI
jgi:hypothetical protein